MVYDRKILDWPYRHRTASTIIGTLLYASISQKIPRFMPVNIKLPEGYPRYISQFLQNAILGFALSIYLINFTRKFNPPRLINTVRGMYYSGLSLILININPRLNLKFEEKCINLYERNETTLLLFSANKKLKTNLGEAFEFYLQSLDLNQKTDKDLYTIFLSEKLELLLGELLIKIHPTLENKLGFLLNYKEISRYEKTFNKIWSRIFRENPDNLELKVIHAMFQSVLKRPEAIDSWRKIIDQTEQSKITESRNEVRELVLNEHLKRSIIIKKGKNLQTEYQTLLAIYSELPDAHLNFPRPLAFYETDDKQVLVLKRKTALPLSELLTPENASSEASKFTETIFKLHGLRLTSANLQPYNPQSEIQRRFLRRFTNEEKFKQAYQDYLNTISSFALVSAHGDAYPTNILRNGNIIIDLETACLAPPSLDLETFFGAPEFSGIDTEEAIKHYPIPLSPEERIFFRIHTSICQTGSSFNQRNQPKLRHFYNRTETLLKDERQFKLLDAFRSCTEQTLKDFL